jgi:tRNA uridine 5-carboxymethylaminomethyl modification enzyme
LAALPSHVRDGLEADALYAGYIGRQEKDIEEARAEEQLKLPQALDFTAVAGLSNELKHKLSRARPATLGHAARVDGMTPAAIAALLTHIRKSRRSNAA